MWPSGCEPSTSVPIDQRQHQIMRDVQHWVKVASGLTSSTRLSVLDTNSRDSRCIRHPVHGPNIRGHCISPQSSLSPCWHKKQVYGPGIPVIGGGRDPSTTTGNSSSGHYLVGPPAYVSQRLQPKSWVSVARSQGTLPTTSLDLASTPPSTSKYGTNLRC